MIGDQSLSVVLPKQYAIHLGIAKADFVKGAGRRREDNYPEGLRQLMNLNLTKRCIAEKLEKSKSLLKPVEVQGHSLVTAASIPRDDALQ